MKSIRACFWAGIEAFGESRDYSRATSIGDSER